MSSPNPNPLGTSVLLIDANDADRTFYANELRRCSHDYRILESTSAKTGLDLYRLSPRIDCVVLEIGLHDRSGFGLLMDLLPIPSRPNVAVIVLTQVRYDGWWLLSKQIGAYASLFKPHTSGEDLDRAIQRAIAFVGLLPKEDRPRLL